MKSHYGIGNEEKKVVLQTCLRCRVTIPSDAKFCPQCSLVLNPRAMAEAKRYEDEIPAIIKALLESEKGRKLLKQI